MSGKYAFTQTLKEIIPFSSIPYDEEKQSTYTNHVKRGSGNTTTSLCTIRIWAREERISGRIIG